MSTNESLLQVRDLRKEFPVKSGFVMERVTHSVKAVDGVSFDIAEGTTLGLVGESGSGKSTTGYCVLQLIKPTAGSIRFKGKELTELGREADAEDAPRDADRLPGSVLVARSADDGRRHRLRAAGGARCRREEGPALACARAPGRRRLQPRLLEPLPPRVLGRPAPARRRGAGARPEPVPDRLRRAGLGARRVDPGADSQPPEGPPAGFRPDLPLHLPRSRRRPLDERPHRGDEGRT